jgi:hypothetical protein
MVPPTGTRGATGEFVKPLLKGESPNEHKNWVNETLIPMLRKEGASDLIDRPGKPARLPPQAADYALTTGTPKDKHAEKRSMVADTKKFEDLRGKVFQMIVDSIEPKSIALNHVSKLITDDVNGSNLNILLTKLKEEVGGAGTVTGLIEFITNFMLFPQSCEDTTPESVVPHVYLLLGELKAFVITNAVPAVLNADGSVAVAEVPAVTCEINEPLRIVFSLVMASLVGNATLINEFVKNEFGTKPHAQQRDFRPLTWTNISDVLKGYMSSDHRITRINQSS